MRRWWIALLAFVGSFSPVFSGENKSEPSVLTPSVSPEAPPASFVNSVHVMNGAFCFASVDLIVPGPVPLNVSHHYNSDTAFYSWMGYSSFASKILRF